MVVGSYLACGLTAAQHTMESRKDSARSWFGLGKVKTNTHDPTFIKELGLSSSEPFVAAKDIMMKVSTHLHI